MPTKAQTIEGGRIISSELMSLNPSAVISLFEIDVNNIASDLAIPTSTVNANSPAGSSEPGIFRFHNTAFLANTSIVWMGETYVGAPIQAQGFDMNMKGTIAFPTLSITVSDAGIPALTKLKTILRSLGDLAGAKVTRRRTLAKYLDAVNFNAPPFGNAKDDNLPPGYVGENWNVAFPDDVFFVHRKSNENKYVIEYELGSVFDVDGLQLPNRIVSRKRCMFQYRGAGCFYEYPGRYNGPDASATSTQAPPVADALDNLIVGADANVSLLGNIALVDRGIFDPNSTDYSVGDFVRITKNNLNYYFVASVTNNQPAVPPPNTQFWISDQCSKATSGCRRRFGLDGVLPFGGYPTVGKFQ